MRRANRGASASLLMVAAVGLLGVVAVDPVTYERGGDRIEVLGSSQTRSATSLPNSVDFLADPDALSGVPVEPSSDATSPSSTGSTVAPPSTAAQPPTSAAQATRNPSTPSEPAADEPAVGTVDGSFGEQSFADLRDAVVASLDYPVAERLPDWRIEFVSERSGYRGSTFPGERLVQVYVREGDSLDGLRHVTAHEIGHAVDVTFMSPTERGEFNQARGRPADAAWWVQSGGDDFASGSGDWAECFAAVVAGPYGFQSRLGGLPDAAQAELIRRLGRA